MRDSRLRGNDESGGPSCRLLLMTHARLLLPTLVLVSVLLAAACASPTPTPTATPEPTATPTPAPTPTPAIPPEDRYEDAPCPPELDGLAAECGYLTVPADYDDPAAGTMRLAVAVLPSKSDSPGVPLAYLDGGPGSNTLASLPYLYGLLADLRLNRDVIVIDQRGSGFSEPSLECSEIKELTFEAVNQALSPQEESRLGKEALRACRDRLAGEGVDLALFHTAANAADIDLLRAALGYEQWDLYGISYGTQLAQTLMRDFPDSLRRVVLDSAYPLDSNLFTDVPSGIERAFRLLTDACAADAACASNYPGLADALPAAVERLSASPEPGSAALPLSGESVETMMTGGMLAGQLFEALYQTDVIPWLPEVITEAAKGNVEPANALLGISLTNLEFTAEGMRLSTLCREEAPYASEEEIAQAVEANPLFASLLDPERLYADDAFEQCAIWNVPPAPAVQNEPVVSDVPALVLAGEYDPITPPSLGKAVAGNLSGAVYVEFPGAGHGLYYAAECARTIIIEFLDGDGSADASCAEERGAPEWVVPLERTAISPVVIEAFGFRGARPEGWAEEAPGVFVRNRIGGPAFILTLVPGVSVDDVLSQTSAGLPLEPDDLGEVSANGLEWSLISFALEETFQALAAAQVSTADGYGADGTLLAVATGMPYYAEALVAHILRPALEIVGLP